MQNVSESRIIPLFIGKKKKKAGIKYEDEFTCRKKEALVLHRQKKKIRKGGKIVYLDGIHYHYSCIVSPLFIMTRINVLPGMHTLDNRGGYYLVKSSSPMGKRA